MSCSVFISKVGSVNDGCPPSDIYSHASHVTNTRAKIHSEKRRGKRQPPRPPSPPLMICAAPTPQRGKTSSLARPCVFPLAAEHPLLTLSHPLLPQEKKK